ncbi:MAG: amidohydrolase [Hyphococcus sp.]|nr:MAG: amidohydrolase [Marinicaulis sp.]
MRHSIILVLLAFISACGQKPEPLEKADLIITGGSIIHPDQTAAPVVEDIVIREGKIVAVGANISGHYDAAQIHDVSGHYIIPGLADMHSHFGNGILAPEEDDTRQVLARHLYFGNTTILNLGSFQAWPSRIDELRAQMQNGSLAGPRLLAVGSLMTMTGSHPTTTIYSPQVQQQIKDLLARIRTDGPIDLTPIRATTLVNTPKNVGAEVKRVGDWGAHAIKLTVESGPDDFGDDHPQMTPEMIAAGVEAAAPYDIPVLCHISSIDEIEACLSSGAHGVVHVVTPAAPLPEDLEQRMVDAEFIVIPTGAMFEGWGRYTGDISLLDQPALKGVLSNSERAWLSSPGMVNAFASTTEWDESVDRTRAHLKKFHDLGGMIVAGTDTGNPYRIAGLALHEEMAFYVSAGLTPREALATATTNAAKFMKAESQWGAIKPDLSADLIILEGNPLDDIANTLTIVDVIKTGEIVNRTKLALH